MTPLFGTLYQIYYLFTLSMPVLKTLVEPEIKDRFCAIAQAQGLSESELLRTLVKMATDQEEGNDKPLKPDFKKSELCQITVRMPRFMLDSVMERAGKKGMATSRWIAALVQSNLTRSPVMNDDEISFLRHNISELVAIGRNINQMSKSLNKNFYLTEQVRLERLAELRIMIEDNKLLIRSLVRASQRSWEAV